MDYKAFLVDENVIIIDALKQLDETAKKILFVIREGKLVAALSDGDVRRWILRGGDLYSSVSKAANYQPNFIFGDQISDARSIMEERGIDALPIVNDQHNVIDIIFLSDESGKKVNCNIDMPVVIMAGGLGTRLYPYTKILPKPLIPIGDVPICERIINLFQGFGCNDFYLIVNYKQNMIKAYFNEIDNNYNISFISEDKPLGTAGGLQMLQGVFDRPFILTNCDTLIFEDYSKIVQYHKEHNNRITMICSIKNYTVPYGVIDLNEDGSIKAMREKPSLSYLTNTGTYIVDPDIPDYIGKDEKIGFPDIIERVRAKEPNKVGIYPISENSWLDMGQFDSMEVMNKRVEETVSYDSRISPNV